MGKCTLLVLAIVVAVQVNAVTMEVETGKSNKVTTLEDMMVITPIRRSRRSIAAMSAADIEAILELHNGLRRQQHGSDMEFMTWDTYLADMAADWAEGCHWGHGQPVRDPTEMPYNPIGQNLYYTTATNIDLESALMAWYNEIGHYNYNLLQCADNHMCGHYTQVVWASSRVVGCAVHRCEPLANTGGRNANYLVCNYGPAGNYIGKKPYNNDGDECTACASGSGLCDGGLCHEGCTGPNCVCALQCHNCGILDPDTCACKCPLGWQGASCAVACVDNGYCGANPGWPTYWCEDSRYSGFMPRYCPMMCGTCGSSDVTCPSE